MSTSLFPPAPSHGMVFELRSGLFFKYDATIRSWIKLTSTGVTVPLATPASAGAMSAIDFKKLNRLVLPPPQSSIIGTDCVAPFRSGNIGLYSGDEFVNVEGTVKVQNIGPRGETISQDIPFHIHQHTYGFDFTVDLPQLVDELKLRNQFNMVGRKGEKGDKGAQGQSGPDAILTGPPGEAGPDGSAPPCGLSVEPDELLVEPKEGMTKALVNGRVVFDDEDPLKYRIVFDRQLIGPTGYAADRLRVQDDTSPWVLAVSGDQPDGPINGPRTNLDCGSVVNPTNQQKIYYIDVEPIVDAIRDRFLREAEIIRGSYQNVVKFWVQTMSDLFDEQKSALCCALERCQSIKKNAETRNNIESIAASAAGSANVLLHGRNSNEAVNLSSTRTLRQLGGPDSCRGGAPFPQYPNLATGGVGGFEGDERGESAAQTQKAESVGEALVTIDPLLHSTQTTAVQVPLQAGNYVVMIAKAEANVDGKYRADVKVQHVDQGVRRSVQFLDKGEFDDLLASKQAYEGLSIAFRHDGGMVSVWLPSLAPQQTSGTIELTIQPVAPAVELPAIAAPAERPRPVAVEQAAELEPQAVTVQEPEKSSDCRMSVSHLAWYQKGWEDGQCCGLVVNVMGQDYIVIKRTIGSDTACGGGESELEPCVAKFMAKGHPAFAWPTFDGKTFVPLPETEFVNFHYDEKLNELVAQQIASGEFDAAQGNPTGVRHLSYQLATVLFPMA